MSQIDWCKVTTYEPRGSKDVTSSLLATHLQEVSDDNKMHLTDTIRQLWYSEEMTVLFTVN